MRRPAHQPTASLTAAIKSRPDLLTRADDEQKEAAVDALELRGLVASACRPRPPAEHRRIRYTQALSGADNDAGALRARDKDGVSLSDPTERSEGGSPTERSDGGRDRPRPTMVLRYDAHPTGGRRRTVRRRPN